MKRDLPTPTEILEELADKTAAQIDRRAPVAFDNAFREMTRYHRFLLALNATKTPDGGAMNYAEIAGNSWNAPHHDWMRQYARLFERAADRIPDDSHFIRSLSYAPIYLLQTSEDIDLSANVIKTILDLGPVMVHRLEGWVTKRTTIETRKGEVPEQRLTLAGSEAKAYANVLPDLVGAWESLLQLAPSLYRWRDGNEQSNSQKWLAFRSSWPFLWQHLTNTAYSLAVSVWNEDEAGSAVFRDTLARWPTTLSYHFEDYADLRQRRLIYPDVLNLSWQEASAQLAPLSFDQPPTFAPERVFASIVRSAHDDVVLLTATLLLFWTINDKQSSNIGGLVAKSLLRNEDPDDLRSSGAKNLSLRSTLLSILRMEMVGNSYKDGSYGANLDGLVRTLDTMTERAVVPGRVFTPSTIHGREDLLLAVTAVLAAATPSDGDDNLHSRITTLAEEEELLPEGDRSLRNVLHELSRLQSALTQRHPQLIRGVRVLDPNKDMEALAPRLLQILHSVETTIQDKRLERLRSRAVDQNKLESLRSSVEESLFTQPAKVGFFLDVELIKGKRDADGEMYTISWKGIRKAQLIDPPMEAPTSRFEETYASATVRQATSYAWRAFARRNRTQIRVDAKIEEKEFWRQIAPLIDQVGPDPTLIISRSAEGRALRGILFGSAATRPELKIEQLPRNSQGGSYIATIQNVSVFGSDVDAGTAWLFSARALRRLTYAQLDEFGRYVNLAFELQDDKEGTLRFRFRQRTHWANTPTFEIRIPDPDEP